MTKLLMDDKAFTKLVWTTKDVFTKIDKFSFLVGFMVLDAEEDPKKPLILGRTFIKTTRKFVDNEKGQAKLSSKDHEVCFHMIDIT